MGTHPIFESDFDCLTVSEMENVKILGSDSEEEMFLKSDYISQLNYVHQNNGIVDLSVVSIDECETHVSGFTNDTTIDSEDKKEKKKKSKKIKKQKETPEEKLHKVASKKTEELVANMPNK